MGFASLQQLAIAVGMAHTAAACRAGPHAVAPAEEPPVAAPELEPEKDDPDPVSVAALARRDAFEGRVGGLRLRSTPSEVVQQCETDGGGVIGVDPSDNEIALTEVGPDDLIQCSPPPTDPFARINRIEAVTLRFCGLPEGLAACEAYVHLRDRDHAAALALRGLLEATYGPAGPFPPDFRCPDERDDRSQFRSEWVFPVEIDGERSDKGFRLVLAYTCAPFMGENAPALTLGYIDLDTHLRSVFGPEDEIRR